MRFENIKAVFLNILSNFLWQILFSILSTLCIVNYITNKVASFLAEKSINNTLAFILFFIIVETILLAIIYFISNKILIRNTEDTPQSEVEDNGEDVIEEIDNEETALSQYDYYFKDYVKHVTIYKDGNGIIMNTFNIVVNNSDNFKEFKRKLNVEDGKKDLVFPSLKDMKKAPKDKRFNEFGFWIYKPSNSIVSSTIEKYWSDTDPDEIDYKSQQNEKEIRWVFEINRGKIKANTEHKISYAISIPGLYPIEKGIFVRALANEPEKNGKASSSIHVQHYIGKITYIISFEDGIKLSREPECFNINGTRVPIHDFQVDEGVFYNKYIFTIENPQYGTHIIINWEFKGGD